MKTLKSRKSTIFILLSLLVVSIILQGCGNKEETKSSGSDKATPTVLNYGFVGTKEPGGIEGWGFHTGIIQEVLKEYGVTEVNLYPFQTGPDLNESVISERIDLGSSGDSPAVLAKSSGADTRIISFSNAQVGTAIIGRKDGPQTVEELKGGTVGVVKGSLMHRFLVDYLAWKGVEDVNIMNINSIPDTEAALLRGEIEAYAVPTYYYSGYKLIQDGHPILGQSSENADFFSVSVVYARQAYIDGFPNLQEAWHKALEKSYADLTSKPDEYYAWLSGNTGASVDEVKILNPIENLPTEFVSSEAIARLNNTKEFLIKEKLAKNDFDTNEWVLQP